MYLLDTDHLSILLRGNRDAQRLLVRLATIDPIHVATTIISYEEQTRGWLSYIAKARSLDQQVSAYQAFQQHLTSFLQIPVVGFDPIAATKFQHLKTCHRTIGSMDLKIAAIALSHDATLLTRNLSDFQQISGLAVEDWTR